MLWILFLMANVWITEDVNACTNGLSSCWHYLKGSGLTRRLCVYLQGKVGMHGQRWCFTWEHTENEGCPFAENPPSAAWGAVSISTQSMSHSLFEGLWEWAWHEKYWQSPGDVPGLTENCNCAGSLLLVKSDCTQFLFTCQGKCRCKWILEPCTCIINFICAY